MDKGLFGSFFQRFRCGRKGMVEELLPWQTEGEWKGRRHCIPSKVCPRNLLLLVSLTFWRPRVLTHEPVENAE